MADQTSPHEPGHQAFVADSAEGEFTVKTSSQSASHLRASASVSSLATFSSPEQRDCLVPSASKTSVCPVANCAPSTAAPGSHSLSSNRRSSLTSFQQGNPELAFIPQLGASAKSDTSELRPHTGFKTSLPTPHQPCASEYANPGSRNISTGMAPLRTRTPLALVPVSCDFRTGAPSQDTRNMTEGTLPSKNADKGNKQFKTIFEKTDGSVGGRGEMVGLHVFTVSPKYEVGFLGNTNPLNYETEEESTVSEDSGEWGWGSVNRSRYSQTPKQPDMRNISNVLDDLIDVFEPQSSSKGSSASLSKRRTSPSRRRLTRSESEKKREMSIINNVFDDLLGVFDPQRDPKSSSVSLSPKRTRSLPLPAGEKRYRVTPPNTKRRKTAVRRWASTLRRRPLSTVKASDKESSSDKTSQEQGDIERVLTACSVLESVNTYVSNEVPQFSQSQLNRNPRQKKGKRKNKKGRRKSGQKSKRSSDDKSKKRRRKLSDVSIDKPRSLSKQKRRRNGGEKSGKGSPVLGREGTETSEDTPKQPEGNKSGDGETLPPSQHGTPRWRKWGTQLLGTLQSSCSPSCPKGSDKLAKPPPKELPSRDRNSVPPRQAPSKGVSHVQNGPANQETANLRKTEHPLETDDYRDTNGNGKTPRKTDSLSSVSSSEVRPDDLSTESPGKLRRVEAKRDVGMKSSSATSKVVDVAVDMEVPVSDDREPKRKTKKRFHEEFPRIYIQEGRRQPASISESEESFVEQDQKGKTIPLSEQPSSTYENTLEEDTEIPAANVLRRQRRRRSKTGKTARNDEPLSEPSYFYENTLDEDTEIPAANVLRPQKRRRWKTGKTARNDEPLSEPSYFYENTLDDDTEIPAANVLRQQKRRSSKTGKTARDDKPLSMPGGRPRHIGPAENRPGGNRERFMPKSEKSRYDKDVSIRNFEAMGAVESESSFENRPHSLTTTLPLNSPARTNTGGSTPYPRNSSRSFSIGSEWRPCESSNYSGAFNVRFRKRRPARPGSPAQRRRKRSFQQRYLGPPLLRPHRTTPLPLTGAQPAPVGYGHRFAD
ncbi:hypothetical protein HPB48_017770 [Haemaphysalis longicornis]|uniref:Uncharacterized protein n=1 Tax=Haemaphysalis longicornis TaxID=44386 RepID=A0A9J6GM54_HAELO|nr:hypothetical protein HPB48_017770 [Haemaphysalis longicornis]